MRVLHTSIFKPGLLLFALIFIQAQFTAQDVEPNSNIATAGSLTLNGSVSGSLAETSATDFNDFFEIVPNSNGEISLSLDLDLGLNARIQLFRSSGAFITQSGVVSGPGVASFTVNCIGQESVYVNVLRSSGSGNYTLSNTFSSPSLANDMEPNNGLAQIQTLISDGSTTSGHLGYITVASGNDVTDTYHILPNDDGRIQLTGVVDSSMNVRYQIFRKNGTFLSQTAVKTGVMSLSVNCVAQDTLVAQVILSSGCGSYSMTFSADTAPTNNDDVEPNNGIPQINKLIVEDETVEGRMGYNGFNISDAMVLPNDDGTIHLNGVVDSTMNVRYQIFRKNGTFLNQTAIKTGVMSLSIDCVAQDTLVAQVFLSSGCGSYTMTFSADTADTAPTNDDDVEPNNGISQINKLIVEDETVEGRMGYNGFNISDNTDTYYILPNDDGMIHLNGEVDSTMNVRYQIFRKNGTFLNQTAIKTGVMSLSVNCVAEDTLVAQVTLSSGCGSYSMTFSSDAPFYQNDVEPNNGIADAIAMANGDVVEGHIGYNGFGISDANDTYSFTVVQAPFELNAKITTAETLSARIQLFNSAGGFITQSAVQSGSFNLENTINTPGTYHIRILLSSGCGSYQLGDLCGLYPADPIISADGPLMFCDGEDVNLTSTSADSYLWSTGATTQSINVDESGSFEVTIFDINGCPATVASPTDVTVFPLPTATISADGPTEFCQGETVTLTANSASSYLWSTGATSQSITVSTSGTYSVSITDSNGCTDTSNSTVVTVNPLPSTPTISANGALTFCDGQSVELTSSSEDSYLWNTGATSQSITVTSSGSFSVTVTDANGCSASSSSTTTTALPNSTWYADTDGDGFGDPNNTTSFCTQPSGFVSNDLDCDDTNADVNPNETEICNGIDDNCDGQIDEGLDQTWFADMDNDGFGDPNNSVLDCAQPAGFVANSLDCDDTNANANPGEEEVCGNGIDDNCDGQIDEDCAGCIASNFASAPTGLNELQQNGTTQLRWDHYSNETAACIIQGGTIGSLDVSAPFTQNPGRVLIQGQLVNGLPNGFDNSAPLGPSSSFTLFNPNTFPAGGTGSMVPGAFYKWRVQCGCIIDNSLPLPDRLSASNVHISPWSGFDLFTNLGQMNLQVEDNQLKILNADGFAIYPNPSNGELNIDISGIESNINNISILNAIGEQVHFISDFNRKDGLLKTDISHFHAGIYLISITTDTGVITSKLIKE